MDEIIPGSKIPTSAEFTEAIQTHHIRETELLESRRNYKTSIEKLDRLFALSVGHALRLGGDVVSLNFIVAGERVPQEKAVWNEIYFGLLRPDTYVVNGAPIETEFDAAILLSPDAPPEGPELLVAYHSLKFYPTARELRTAQRIFDRDQ